MASKQRWPWWLQWELFPGTSLHLLPLWPTNDIYVGTLWRLKDLRRSAGKTEHTSVICELNVKPLATKWSCMRTFIWRCEETIYFWIELNLWRWQAASCSTCLFVSVDVLLSVCLPVSVWSVVCPVLGNVADAAAGDCGGLCHSDRRCTQRPRVHYCCIPARRRWHCVRVRTQFSCLTHGTIDVKPTLEDMIH